MVCHAAMPHVQRVIYMTDDDELLSAWRARLAGLPPTPPTPHEAMLDAHEAMLAAQARPYAPPPVEVRPSSRCYDDREEYRRRVRAQMDATLSARELFRGRPSVAKWAHGLRLDSRWHA